MPTEAENIAARESLDLATHRGRQITTPIVRNSDLILVMERGQLDWIVSSFPESRGRVFMATHWVGGDDIADPFRKSAAFFEQVYEQIEQALAEWSQRLRSR
ncbi:Low molecular weight phosphotyrosine protein phosphatase [Salinisphaera hydrothermalis C27AD]